MAGYLGGLVGGFMTPNTSVASMSLAEFQAFLPSDFVKNSYFSGSIAACPTACGGILGGVYFASASVEDTYNDGFHIYDYQFRSIKPPAKMSTASYYDKSVAGSNLNELGVGLNFSEMKSGVPFSAWDLTVWKFQYGFYPALKR